MLSRFSEPPLKQTQSNHDQSVEELKKSLSKQNSKNLNKSLFMTFKNQSEQKKSNLCKSLTRFTNYRSNSKSKQKSKNKEKLSKFNCTQRKLTTQSSLSRSKQKIIDFDKKVRRNNKKFISRQNSAENLQMRVKWGVDQPRLNNYVLETLAKMQKLRKHQKQKKQNTFNTDRSQNLKQSDYKLELTPKKAVELDNQKIKVKNKDKVVKSPAYDEKTYKKQQSLTKLHPEEKPTEKQKKKNSNVQQKKVKIEEKLPDLIYKSINSQFQSLQKNNLYHVNFRIVNKKIIEIQLAILKKADSLTVNLIKGSLQCQSICQNYKDILPKSSIILMSVVSGLSMKHNQKYKHPQLHINLTQKSGSFAMHKKILIPFSQIFLVQPIQINNLKQLKLGSKIKTKSVIEGVPYRKELFNRLDKIFQYKCIKTKGKETVIYCYGFVFDQTVYIMRLIVRAGQCQLQCQGENGSQSAYVLSVFQTVLGL